MPGAAPPASRGGGEMPAPARALHLVLVVLGGPRPRPGQVGDLMGVPDAQVTGQCQVRAAAAAGALGEQVPGLVRMIVPRQERPRSAGLLARPALPGPCGLRLRGLLPRLVIGARRHRGIPAVTGDDPLQPGDLLRLPLYQRPQVRDHRVLVLVQQPQPLQRLPQPPVLRTQLSSVRRIGRTRHTALHHSRHSAGKSTPQLADRGREPQFTRGSECLRRRMPFYPRDVVSAAEGAVRQSEGRRSAGSARRGRGRGPASTLHPA